MSLPSQAEYVIVGAGIHGLSTAWRLAERLTAAGESIEGRIVIIDKADRIAAGATGIACGVVRNNYFQPAMRKLMAHSVSIWESDPEAFSYHANGYMQISCEKMREDVKQIHAEQKAIGYESVFIEGEEESREYMLNMFDDWQAQGITSVLHEKKGGYANNTKAMYGLAKKVEDLGVRIITGVEVTGFTKDENNTVSAVETNQGSVSCENVVIGAGPWVRDFWKMLDYNNVSDRWGDKSVQVYVMGDCKLRFYGSIQNVRTFTDYDGLDPEIYGGIDNNFYPRPQTGVLGFSIDF